MSGLEEHLGTISLITPDSQPAAFLSHVSQPIQNAGLPATKVFE